MLKIIYFLIRSRKLRNVKDNLFSCKILEVTREMIDVFSCN